MESLLRNVEHERAKYAFECVNMVKNTPGAKRYKSLARSSGPLILKSGLVQALIFYLSKGDEIFVKDILKKCDSQFNDSMNAGQIAEKLTTLNQDEIMRITQEALQIIKWIKRFAEIILEE